MPRLQSRPVYMLIAMVALSLSACATRPPVSDPEARAEFDRINDPLEPLNRFTFQSNNIADTYLIRPLMVGYRFILPGPLEQAISNIFRNAGEPFTLGNDILQASPGRAGKTLSRLVINSTLGIGGIFEVASSQFDIPYHNEDLGQTFARWGVPPGPYVMLPAFGPSNIRDGIARIGQFWADPIQYAYQAANVKGLQLGINVVELMDTRLRADDAIKQLNQSPDPYVTARTAYRQFRAFEIANGSPPVPEEEDDFFEEDF